MGSTSGTGRKWGVPQVQGGSGEYLRYRDRETVVITSGKGRKWGVPQVKGGSGEYLQYREEVTPVRSTSGSGREGEVALRRIPSNIELVKADLVKQKWAVGENKELVQQSRSLRLRQIRGAFLEYVQRIKNPCFSLQIF